jgi:hypothetical protein
LCALLGTVHVQCQVKYPHLRQQRDLPAQRKSKAGSVSTTMRKRQRRSPIAPTAKSDGQQFVHGHIGRAIVALLRSSAAINIRQRSNSVLSSAMSNYQAGYWGRASVLDRSLPDQIRILLPMTAMSRPSRTPVLLRRCLSSLFDDQLAHMFAGQGCPTPELLTKHCRTSSVYAWVA